MDTEADLQLLTEASLANSSAIHINNVNVCVDELMNIVDAQQVEEDLELTTYTPGSTCNEADLDEAAHEALCEYRKNCLVQTLRGYKKGLRYRKV
jgi:hypothetical protein